MTMSADGMIQGGRGSLQVVRIRRYLVEGKESSRRELAGQPFIAAGTDLPEEGTAYGFSTEESLCRWAAGTRQAVRFARAIGTMKLGQQLEGTDVAARALPRIEATAERLTAELAALAEETGLALGSPELFITAATARSVLEPPLFDPTLLFDRVDDEGDLTHPPVFGGKLFPVFATIPTFGRFNDKASGAQVFGVCTLHDRTFFRGAAAFLLGSASFILADLGFDNRAASGIAV
jgi:hypothetical protein